MIMNFLEWRDIPEHELYMISEYFHIVSFNECVPLFKKYKQREDTLIVNLCFENKSVDYKVEYLAASAFLPNPNNYLYVVYIGDRNYHHISNIKWSRSPILGYENLEFKDILNADNYKIYENGELLSFRYHPPCIKNPYVLEENRTYSKRRYLITENDGTEKIYDSDFLVARAFIPNPNNYEYVIHINGDYDDDHYQNLTWSNVSELPDGKDWRIVPIFEDYKVTIDGQFKSYHKDIPRLLHPTVDEAGYPKINLHKNGEVYRFSVHRLIASIFVENPLNKPMVDHIDRNRLNYKASNLRWVTAKENSANRDNSNSQCQKAVIQLDLDENIINIFQSAKEAGEILGISVGGIRHCARGEGQTSGGYKWDYLEDDEELPYIPQKGEIFTPTVGLYGETPINYPNYIISNFGVSINVKTGLRKTMVSNQYGVYSFCHEGKAKYFRAHILVASFFVEGRTPERCIVNHRDENKFNPHYLNLEWVTQKENVQYSVTRKYYRKVMEELLNKIMCVY